MLRTCWRAGSECADRLTNVPIATTPMAPDNLTADRRRRNTLPRITDWSASSASDRRYGGGSPASRVRSNSKRCSLRVISKESLERLQGPMQMGLDASLADAKRFGDDVHRPVVQIAQDDNIALSSRQTSQGSGQRQPQHRHVAGIDCPGVNVQRLPLPMTQHIDGQVRGHTRYPRVAMWRRFDPIPVQVCARQSLGRDVLGRLDVEHETKGDSIREREQVTVCITEPRFLPPSVHRQFNVPRSMLVDNRCKTGDEPARSASTTASVVAFVND